MIVLTRPLIAAFALSLAAGPALAEEKTEGRKLAELSFEAVDGAERGYIDQGEFTNFGGDVFYSMDYDDDGKLTLGEFMAWDPGMQPIAAEKGREAAYETALRVVFAFWDRNGDNLISRTEHQQSLQADFRRADFDNDAVLSKQEFTTGFSVMVALRAAINPAPIE
ncbi:MAG: signal transduction protein [Silicimonas sp.]|nr:signal transduction protein [Silicimonas sp.]